MKKTRHLLDAFVLSGFLASCFSGFLNPLYVSLILSRLDGRIIAVGSFMSSAFPVLVGLALGNRAVFARLYAVIPCSDAHRADRRAGFRRACPGGPARLLPGVHVRPRRLLIVRGLPAAEDKGGAVSPESRLVRPPLRHGGRLRAAGGFRACDRRRFLPAGSARGGRAGGGAGRVVCCLFLLLYRAVPQRRRRGADEEGTHVFTRNRSRSSSPRRGRDAA